MSDLAPEWFIAWQKEREQFFYYPPVLYTYIHLHRTNIKCLVGKSKVGSGTASYRKLKEDIANYEKHWAVPSIQTLADLLLERGDPLGEYLVRVVNEVATFERLFEQYKKDNPKSTARLEIKD